MNLSSYDYILAIFWVVVFVLIILFSFLYVIYPTIKAKTNDRVTKFKNRLSCAKIKEQEKIEKWTIFIWADTKKILLVNAIAIGLFFFSILIYILSGIWLYMLTFILYLVLLKYLYKWYKEFPEIAAQRLKEHEEAIEKALIANIKTAGDRVEKLLIDEEKLKGTPLEYLATLDFEIIKHPTDVKKFDFPPFVKLDAAKKKVIASRKMQYFVLARDFMLAALNPTPFDLLNPKRADEKKQCTLVRVPGDTRDYFYSMIRRVYYDADEKGIKVEFNDPDNDPPIVMKVAKAPDAKPSILKIKERKRIIERQRWNKIDEIYKFYALKDALKVSVENINTNENEDSNEAEEESEDKK